MAILRLEDGTTYRQPEAISRELEPLKVQLKYWLVGDDAVLHRLLAKATLDETEKEQVLQGIENYFESLKKSQGYQDTDLVVLSPQTSKLDTLLAKFRRCHIHADDEVRYIIDGEGVFGFVRPNGSQIELTMQAEEYINIPAGTEHWFYLTEMKRIKVVRYFTNTEGWTPEYTQTEICFPSSIMREEKPD